MLSSHFFVPAKSWERKLLRPSVFWGSRKDSVGQKMSSFDSSLIPPGGYRLHGSKVTRITITKSKCTCAG